jgi:hypothetical protein
MEFWRNEQYHCDPAFSGLFVIYFTIHNNCVMVWWIWNQPDARLGKFYWIYGDSDVKNDGWNCRETIAVLRVELHNGISGGIAMEFRDGIVTGGIAWGINVFGWWNWIRLSMAAPVGYEL